VIAFISGRLFHAALALFGVLFIIFFLFRCLPAERILGGEQQRADINAMQEKRHELGLDLPLYKQLIIYLNDLSPVSIAQNTSFLPPSGAGGCFLNHNLLKYGHYKTLIHAGNYNIILKEPFLNNSYQDKRKVTTIIASTLPVTALLALSAILFASLCGISLGIIAALNKNTFIDKFSIALSIAGFSAPSFFIGLLFAWLFGFVLSKYSHLNVVGNIFVIDDMGNTHLVLKNLILPALTLGIRPLAIITQLMRNSLLAVLSKEYITTAYAKGLSTAQIIFRHAIRNAINPVITSISGWLASMLAGAVFVEYIFGLNGIGGKIVTSLERYDLPVIMGIVLVTSVIFIVINILTDIMYSIIDPRIRLT
jgi:peptide/nickel transport system permease protein